ncbi:unnamed protein product [Closterium sp. NIES-53]
MYLMTCTRPDLAYPLSLLARYVAPVRRAWGSCLEDGLELSSLVALTPPGSSCEAEIYAWAMAAQELRWLTYLLTDLGEAPRSPPVMYQRGQLRLAYVASQANTVDVFTKALQPCDHQRTVRRCHRSLLLACQRCSRPPPTALPVPRAVHRCTSVARYRTAIPAESLDKNQPPMFITLYFTVTRLPNSLHSVRDHFLSLDPTIITIDLLEQHLLAAETSVVAVGAARGTPRTPFFEGCSPPLCSLLRLSCCCY